MKGRIAGTTWAIMIGLLLCGPLTGCDKLNPFNSPTSPSDTITYTVTGDVGTPTAGSIQYATPNNVAVATNVALPWISPALGGYETFADRQPGLTVNLATGCVTASILQNAEVKKSKHGCGTPLVLSLSW
jgi:hypothetical protein